MTTILASKYDQTAITFQLHPKKTLSTALDYTKKLF